jgi:hypothetical protein
MRELRKNGFANADISVIVDGKWKVPTIKKDTRGVKTVSTNERDKLLGLLSDFSSTGGKLHDLEEFSLYKTRLDSIGVNYVSILDLLYHYNDLLYVKDLLIKSDLTLDDFLEHFVIMENLKKQGIFDQELNMVIHMAQAYGGINGIYKALEKFGDIESLKNNEIKTQVSLNILQTNFTKLEQKYTTLKPFVDFAETLILNYSFNRESLDILVKVTEKYGGLGAVLEALTEYGSIYDLRLVKAKEIKQSENFKTLTDATIIEYTNISENVKEVHQNLGEIKANYKQSLRLQKIQDLLTNPREAKMNSDEFLRLVSALISGILEYGNKNKESIAG